MTIKVTYNITDVYVTQDVSPVYINVSYSSGGGSGAAVWGSITGTISDQTDLQTALDLKVPYTGATTNVNLGEYEIKAGQVTLDTSPTGTASVGTTRWNDTTGLSETTLKGGTVVLKNGVDLVARVVNKVSPNTTLTKAAYQAVRVSGAQGQRLAVAFAQANNDNNSADTIGLVIETIATNQEGFIMTVGQIEGINTTGSLQGETWNDGDIIYLSPTVAGAVTNVKPSGGQHLVIIGYVEYAHAVNGRLYIKISNGWEITELHDVDVTSPANNEALIYESATALWKNKSIATALGYTPANAATTLTINGVTYDLSTSRTWTISAGISGSGASGQVAYWTGTSAQSGSNNLFWDNTNGRLGIGTNSPSASLHIVKSTVNDALLLITPNNNSSQYPFFLGGATLTSEPYLRANNNILEFNRTGAASTIRTVGSTNNLVLQSSNDLLLNTNGANERVRIFVSTGNLGIGTGATDSGQRLQVQGTTLLNGNVTFSSATGMFWDATNSRVGIGLNNPADTLHLNTGGVRIQNIRASLDNFYTAGVVNGLKIQNTTTNGRTLLGLVPNGTSNLADFWVFNTSDTTTNYSALAWGFESTSSYWGINSISAGTAQTRPIYINATNGQAVASSNISFFTNGNVGIGTGSSNSGERLQVTGNVKITGNVAVDTNSLFVDTTNKRIGVRTATPGAPIDVWNSAAAENAQYRISDSRVAIPNYSGVGFSPALTSNTLGFFATSSSSTGGVQFAGFTNTTATASPFIFVGYHGSTAPTVGAMRFLGFKHDGSTGRTALTGNEIIAGFAAGTGADVFQVKANGRINMSSLPTSSSGLATGDLWNNGGVINIV